MTRELTIERKSSINLSSSKSYWPIQVTTPKPAFYSLVAFFFFSKGTISPATWMVPSRRARSQIILQHPVIPSKLPWIDSFWPSTSPQCNISHFITRSAETKTSLFFFFFSRISLLETNKQSKDFGSICLSSRTFRRASVLPLLSCTANRRTYGPSLQLGQTQQPYGQV